MEELTETKLEEILDKHTDSVLDRLSFVDDPIILKHREVVLKQSFMSFLKDYIDMEIKEEELS